MSQEPTYSLEAIPFVSLKKINGRFLISTLFYDQKAWRMWLPAGDKLLEVKVAGPAEMFYFGSEPASKNDTEFDFLSFIAQRASFPPVKKAVAGLMDDIFNITASIATIKHLHATRSALGEGVSRMAVTEVEYLIFICRGIFDFLQEVVSRLWEQVSFFDSTQQKKSLKDRQKFSEVVVYNRAEATFEQIKERTGMPDQLVAWYCRYTQFFMSLKTFRDNLVHRGSQVQTIFVAEDGFAIQERMMAFKALNPWFSEEKGPNSLVPLMPALAMIVNNTLAACEDLSLTMRDCIKFPDDLVPGMSLYMRSYFNESFMEMLSDLNNRMQILTQQSGATMTGIRLK